MQKKRVLLAMSGGTDSSVTAILLKEAGYEVVGVTFRFFESGGNKDYLKDAAELAGSLGIKHLIYDARETFAGTIVDYFIREYLEGKTPVPCVLCNNYFKWPLLCKIADREGIRYVASGHYVRKAFDGKHFFIRNGIDPEKDQSFFLWGLTQDILLRALFPLGNLTKTRIREIAREKGFMKVASRKDSMGVCFCPGDYRKFLREYAGVGVKQGVYVDTSGVVMGKHKGYPFYTVGQRRGLGIYLNRALFVHHIDPEKNRITLGDLKGLERTEILLKEWNVIHPEKLFTHKNVFIKLRYRKQENYGGVIRLDDGNLLVNLHQPVTAVAPGQAVAFYDKGVLLGGGIIVR